MNQISAFRLSTYLTVAVAVASLGYAEAQIFPEVGAFAVAVVVTLAVIYRLEPRVRLLSLADANKLAVGIAGAGFVWAGYRIVREYRHDEFGSLGWPLFLVTLIAPVLMAAVAAKFLRREKHAGDYWYLHAAALGGVVLAASTVDRIVGFGLIVVYAVCAVWSLYHFSVARAGGTVPPIPSRRAATTPPLVPVGTPPAGLWGRVGFAGAVLLTTAAGAVALPLYLVTPRSTFEKLEFGHARIEIGFAADQMIDLNKTGDLGLNREPAFEVVAADARGRPKDDLNPEQRWRGIVLSEYHKGTWVRTPDIEFPLISPTARPGGIWSPPDLGPDRYSLTFTVPTRLRSVFLADPVGWVGGGPSPVADVGPNGLTPWYPTTDGGFTPIRERPRGQRDVRYVQYHAPSPNPDLGPGFSILREGGRILTTNPVPAVKEYADSVLGELIGDGRLRPEVRILDTVRLRPPDEFHEAIARAFRDHLGEGGFTYTTELPRVPKGMDPVEHFLLHSRTGHCERFASALALLLRSQGIPAVVVLGFKGCEHVGGGRYVIRQEHAHAWVEALISRPVDPDRPPGPGARRPARLWHWVSLDPAPTAGRRGTDEAGRSDDLLSWGRSAFERYVTSYTEQERERAIRGAADALTSPAFLGTVGGAVAAIGCLIVGWRWRRATPRPAPPSGRWFDRLLSLLAAHGFTPRPGETAREFAADTAATLRGRPATAAVAAVPVEWGEAYYQTRFGGVPLLPDRRADLDDRLEQLRRALSELPRSGS